MRSPGTEATAVSPSSGQARLLGALAWLVGLGLIATQNIGDVVAAVAVAGWSIAFVGLAHLGTLLADTLGWQALFRRPQRHPWAR